MRIGDRLDDREPQSRSTGSSITRSVGAVKAMKDTLTLIRRDPRTVVFDEKANPPARERLHAHAHQAAIGSGVLDRVTDQVA